MKVMEQSRECEEQLTKLLEGEATVCCCGSSTQGTLDGDDSNLVELRPAPGSPRKSCDANQR